MSKNQYGVDMHYVKKNLDRIIRELDCYKPGELQRDLRRIGDSQVRSCDCYRCTANRQGHEMLSKMILCPKCGNKRCPHATDHKNWCTNSNDPNQTGSRY